jgi:hypothetical protein
MIDIKILLSISYEVMHHLSGTHLCVCLDKEGDRRDDAEAVMAGTKAKDLESSLERIGTSSAETKTDD